jgi:hypothetical protein
MPMLRPDLDQHHPGRLNEQRAQIAIAESPDWLKFKNLAALAVKREAEEDWSRALAVMERAPTRGRGPGQEEKALRKPGNNLQSAR